MHESNREKVLSVCRRLFIYQEEMEDQSAFPREKLISMIEDAYKNLAEETFHKMLGCRMIRMIRQTEKSAVPLHDDCLKVVCKSPELIYPYEELECMGLARKCKNEPGSFHVEKYVFDHLRSISEEEMNQLEWDDEMCMLIDTYLLIWGAVEYEVLVDAVFSKVPIGARDLLGTILRELIGFRKGQDCVYENEKGDLFILSRHALDNEKLQEAVSTHLWEKLPYWQPDDETFEKSAQMFFVDKDDALIYRYVAGLTGKLTIPENESDFRYDLLHAFLETEQGAEIMARLGRARWMTLQGEMFDALHILMYNEDIQAPSRKAQVRQYAYGLIASFPQWAYKGWSFMDVFGDNALTDKRRTEVLEACTMGDRQEPSFHDLCPCGSGKLYGHCHGRAM